MSVKKTKQVKDQTVLYNGETLNVVREFEDILIVTKEKDRKSKKFAIRKENG